MKAKIRQSVIVPDIERQSLKDPLTALALMTHFGVRAAYGIPYSPMFYSRHHHNERMKGEVWEFSNYPFEPQIERSREG